MNKNTYEQAKCKQADSGVAITYVETAVYTKLAKNMMQAHTPTCAPMIPLHCTQSHTCSHTPMVTHGCISSKLHTTLLTIVDLSIEDEW